MRFAILFIYLRLQFKSTKQMNTTNSIFNKTLKIGDLELPNRIVMPPLTRMRANKDFAANDMMAEYYAQRADAGLIIAEASQISQQAQGYPTTPAIYNQEHIDGWKKVTNAVHQNNGRIFLQLWHVGRISHSAFQVNNSLPVAPSAIPAIGNAFLPDWGRVPYETPHALSIPEIKQIIEDYRQAAINAMEAGFDGIEIHAANGYLMEQFFRSVSNVRDDEYGGSIENRTRILFEVLDAVLSVVPNKKVGVRISPFFTGTIDLDPQTFELYDYIVNKLEKYNLAYLHIIESQEPQNLQSESEVETYVESLLVARYRKLFSNPIITAGGFDREIAIKTLEKNYADAIAFGKAFISTPDLTNRMINDIEINPLDDATVYGGTEKGYTDYATLAIS